MFILRIYPYTHTYMCVRIYPYTPTFSIINIDDDPTVASRFVWASNDRTCHLISHFDRIKFSDLFHRTNICLRAVLWLHVTRRWLPFGRNPNRARIRTEIDRIDIVTFPSMSRCARIIGSYSHLVRVYLCVCVCAYRPFSSSSSLAYDAL